MSDWAKQHLQNGPELFLKDLKISMSFQHFNPGAQNNTQIQSPMCFGHSLLFGV